MIANLSLNVASSQAANPDTETVIEENNLPDILYQNLRDNVNLCERHILDEQTFDFDDRSTAYQYFYVAKAF